MFYSVPVLVRPLQALPIRAFQPKFYSASNQPAHRTTGRFGDFAQTVKVWPVKHDCKSWLVESMRTDGLHVI
jgi:hypothetical protein